jgi:hypothetical protein
MSYSILSSVERLLMGYGLLDSFMHAMRENPVRLPGDPNLRKDADPPPPPQAPPSDCTFCCTVCADLYDTTNKSLFQTAVAGACCLGLASRFCG